MLAGRPCYLVAGQRITCDFTPEFAPLTIISALLHNFQPCPFSFLQKFFATFPWVPCKQKRQAEAENSLEHANTTEQDAKKIPMTNFDLGVCCETV